MSNPFSRLDTWERIKAHILDAAPLAGSRITDAAVPRYRSMPETEAQVLVLMAKRGWDAETPALRRRARADLQSFLEGEGPAGEEPATPGTGGTGRSTGPTANRDRLRQTLSWVSENPPSRWLAAVSGPQAAVAEVSRRAKCLAGLQPYRWLCDLGYPMAVPDLPRQKLMKRLGWLEEVSASTLGRRRALSAMESVAHEFETPLAELNVVLGIFCGSCAASFREASVCLEKPRCSCCPVRESCVHHAAEGSYSRERGSRRLTMTVREEDRPRERLGQHGAASLKDEELLAILIRTGSGEENAVDLARSLLTRYGDLESVSRLSVKELTGIGGLGKVKATTILAAMELARRLQRSLETRKLEKVTGAKAVFEHLRPRFLGARKEEFLAILVDTKIQVMRIVPISTGTLNQSLVHPREAFLEAIRDSAHAVIFVHNHPSGDPAPSRHDHAVTQRLVKAGELMGVKVLDHVIIGADSYYSFSDAGLLRA